MICSAQELNETLVERNLEIQWAVAKRWEILHIPIKATTDVCNFIVFVTHKHIDNQCTLLQCFQSVHQ